MTDTDKKSTLDLRGIDPRKPFFLATMAGNSDGSLDELGGEYEVTDTVEKAVEYLLEQLDDALLDGYVFHCIPVRYIGRGPLRVRPLRESPVSQRKANRKKQAD